MALFPFVSAFVKCLVWSLRQLSLVEVSAASKVMEDERIANELIIVTSKSRYGELRQRPHLLSLLKQ